MQGMSGLAIPTKQADVECPIHHIRMRYVPNGKFTEPFCMKCVAEKTEVQKQEHDKSIISDSSRRYFKGYSLLDNSEQYSLSTYWTQAGRKLIYDVLKQNEILPLIERDDIA